MISVLSENVFNDVEEHFYVTIDTLDEEWADDRIRFKLIKSLIDTIRRFRKIENIKVIAAIRQDLLTKILHQDPTPGFQEEKYESLYLNIRWSKKELYQLIERRINHLIKRRYTKGDVSFNDVFPSRIEHQSTIDYLTDRTFLRPRDIILFLNECLALADGRPSITETLVKQAEERYSHRRLQSLATEWHMVYPNLVHVAKLFYGHNKCNIPVSEITKDFIESRYTEIVSNIKDTGIDPITRLLDTLYTADANFGAVRARVLQELYMTGFIGIKAGPSAQTQLGISVWSYPIGRGYKTQLRDSHSSHVPQSIGHPKQLFVVTCVGRNERSELPQTLLPLKFPVGARRAPQLRPEQCASTV